MLPVKYSKAVQTPDVYIAVRSIQDLNFIMLGYNSTRNYIYPNHLALQGGIKTFPVLCSLWSYGLNILYYCKCWIFSEIFVFFSLTQGTPNQSTLDGSEISQLNLRSFQLLKEPTNCSIVSLLNANLIKTRLQILMSTQT